MWRRVSWTALALLVLMLTQSVSAAPKTRQYVFAGSCNGLDHWVSVLYEPELNRITNIVAKATCPGGAPSVSRVIRGRAIPITVGGQFGDVVSYPGISYLVTGRVYSKSKATLAIKGPPKLLTCPNQAQQKSVCERFTLKAK